MTRACQLGRRSEYPEPWGVLPNHGMRIIEDTASYGDSGMTKTATWQSRVGCMFPQLGNVAPKGPSDPWKPKLSGWPETLRGPCLQA